MTVLIIGGLVVGGYILLSRGNGGNSGNITSIDFNMKGFEGGNLGGNTRYRAKNIGSDSLKVRVDKVGGEDILIFDYGKNVEYAYTGTSWMKFQISKDSSYTEVPFEKWAQKGPGTYEFDYQNFSVEVTINDVNPSLKDNLFSPPENATIIEPDTS